jgi:uncharacterized membrane protein (DUF2068 family)
MARPVGVTIIAIGSFLGAAIVVLSGVRFLAGSGFMASVFREQASNADAASGLSEVAAAAILLTIVFGALYALSGWGLWKLKNWGRILTISLVAIASGFELLRWYLTLHFKMSHFVATAVSLTLYLVIVLYLVKPDIKARFLANQTESHVKGLPDPNRMAN